MIAFWVIVTLIVIISIIRDKELNFFEMICFGILFFSIGLFLPGILPFTLSVHYMAIKNIWIPVLVFFVIAILSFLSIIFTEKDILLRNYLPVFFSYLVASELIEFIFDDNIAFKILRTVLVTISFANLYVIIEKRVYFKFFNFIMIGITSYLYVFGYKLFFIPLIFLFLKEIYFHLADFEGSLKNNHERFKVLHWIMFLLNLGSLHFVNCYLKGSKLLSISNCEILLLSVYFIIIFKYFSIKIRIEKMSNNLENKLVSINELNSTYSVANVKIKLDINYVDGYILYNINEKKLYIITGNEFAEDFLDYALVIDNIEKVYQRNRIYIIRSSLNQEIMVDDINNSINKNFFGNILLEENIEESELLDLKNVLYN